MLCEIYCEKFHQKYICFNTGLSVVLGTNAGANSIGKSTFLLIIDYIFGGNTYAETQDITNNVGPHDIFFSFSFDNQVFWFCRNNMQKDKLWRCNESLEKLEEIRLADYCSWLKVKYNMNLPDLSFRDAISRYIRVYGKNNCDEKQPLHRIPTEKAEKASYALLKLFDAYTPLKNAEVETADSKTELDTYKKAQKSKFISKITKTTYNQNQKNIDKITKQLDDLATGLEKGLHDVDAIASEEAVRIKQLLSRARRARSRINAQLTRVDENGDYTFSSTQESFDALRSFFPGVDIAHLEEIEKFHKTIASIFKSELREKRIELEKELADYDDIIHQHEAVLQSLIKSPNLSKAILMRHAELLRTKEQMEKENSSYDKLQQLINTYRENISRLNAIKKKQYAIISTLLNDEMRKINNSIYEGLCNAPILNFENSSYSFYTPDDTGTGIAYKGLVVFDLSVLNLTSLPLLVHDSIVLKQISDDAIEKIIELYSSCGKQVIIALDKQDSYSEKASNLLGNATVLKLAGNGQELFGRSWG